LEAAQYLFLWTTLSLPWSRLPALDLYRSRWQIELAFKRMKSLMGLGHLSKKRPGKLSCMATRKLLTGLLIERAAKTISPWGYQLRQSPKPMA
jgi:hypothetical protein